MLLCSAIPILSASFFWPALYFFILRIYLSPLFLLLVMIEECIYLCCRLVQMHAKNPMAYCMCLLWFASIFLTNTCNVVTMFSLYHCSVCNKCVYNNCTYEVQCFSVFYENASPHCLVLELCCEVLLLYQVCVCSFCELNCPIRFVVVCKCKQ